jgi:hypothetical protein
VPPHPKIVVSDPSVVMDLAKGRLIEATLALPYEFVIPDVMLVQELLDLGSYSRADLLRLGFKLGDLDGDGVGGALRHYKDYHGDLSLNDCFALVLAQRLGCILLTDEGNLRAVAEKMRLEVRSLLWTAEQIFHHNTCPIEQLLCSLETLERDGSARPRRPELAHLIASLRRRR